MTPLVSLHHLDVVDPIFPGISRVEGLQRLFESSRLDSANLMQQSICYDKERYWSISVSWGYVVQIIRGNVSPRELEMPTRTFLNWYKRADYTAYAFNTRPVTRHPCQKPFVYYMNTAKIDHSRNQIIGIYYRHREPSPSCRWKIESPENINNIVLLKRPDNNRWQKVQFLTLLYITFVVWCLDQLAHISTITFFSFLGAVSKEGLLWCFTIKQ